MYLSNILKLDGDGHAIAPGELATLSSLQEALMQLDGLSVSSVIACDSIDFSKGPTPHLQWHPPYVAYVGGDDGRCIVFMTLDDEEFRHLENTDDGATVRINDAGQPTEVSGKRAIKVLDALLATRSFVELGVLDETFEWPRDA